MNIGLGVVALLVGYFIGSISFARIIGRRIAPGADLTSTKIKIEGASRDFEVKTVSATSLSMREGPRAGCTVAILDMLKAALPMLYFWWQYPEQPALQLITAFAAILGHNFPIYYRFVGGRGLSSILGSLVVIDPLSVPVTIIVSNLVGLGIFKDFMLGYTGWLFLLIPWLWWRFDHWMYPAYAAAVTALYLIASIPEIRLYFEFKRAKEFDKANSYLEAFEHTDVGRPIKYMRKYGLLKTKTNGS
ncbi:MAG: glycerol-3-phosphate acyltransferase [Ardenticatenaceae bacterium]|nr:glycerol-3-phosphate acyltransferase [Ardenticatenaceae bacterium]